MFAIIELVLVVLVMARVADAEPRSPLVWGGLTLVACLGASVLIPLVFIAPIAGGVAVLLAMLVADALRGPV